MAKTLEGKCAKCGCDVWSNQLFVEEWGSVYHYSCYNKMKKEEEERKRNKNKDSGSGGRSGGWFGW